MPHKKQFSETVTLGHIVGGGQCIANLESGKKVFVWGGLPGETVTVRVGKQKSSYAEAIVESVQAPSLERALPRDPESCLSTSPWQIMTMEAEQRYKAALIEEAFELHDVVLPEPIDVWTNGVDYGYRNKVEFSWYGDKTTTSGDDAQGRETLDLAFFRRGSKGKIPVDGTSLARPEINQLARAIRDLLRTKNAVTARNLKTVMIRCDQSGNTVWQLYIKDEIPDIISTEEAALLPAAGGEVIYSDPRSPASRITKRLASFGDTVLTDSVLGVDFRYATEGFFQVNIPVYEQALRDMQGWVTGSGGWEMGNGNRLTPGAHEAQTYEVQPSRESAAAGCEGSAFPAAARQDPNHLASSGPEQPAAADSRGEETFKANAARPETPPVLDLYSGVGSIGLTIGGPGVTLVESDENAYREMRRNIAEQGSAATAVLSPSEKSLEYITPGTIVIVDPPRAGLHTDVIERLLQTKPPRIIYLSCNPVTQARDTALLCADKTYGIRHHRGYNFFPRTPHIEHLVVLELAS